MIRLITLGFVLVASLAPAAPQVGGTAGSNPAPLMPAPLAAGPDMASTYYEIEIPCSSSNGLSAVRTVAEFVTIRTMPRNLTVSLVYRQ